MTAQRDGNIFGIKRREKKNPKEGKLVTREFKKMKLAVQHGSVMEQVRDSGYQISKYNTDRRTAILR